MDKNHIIDLLPAYLDGALDSSQKKTVEAHLEHCSSCKKELEAFQTLFKAIKDDEIDVPSERMRTNFHEQLELEKRSSSKVVSIDSKAPSRKNTWIKDLLKIAAGVALLLGAYFTGKYESNENSNSEITSLTSEKLKFKQTAMLSLMENESASKRIQGVNLVAEFTAPDEAIVKALNNRMLYDENTNVRLAAVEALSNFSKSELVKSAFIKALGTDKDPSVQIAIIQILVKIQEKKAIDPMKQLLQQEGTQPFVKKEITQVLPEIIS